VALVDGIVLQRVSHRRNGTPSAPTRAELGYCGATALLCGLLAAAYRRA
jgi:hypothetical protein